MGRTYEEYELDHTDDIYHLIDEVQADQYDFFFTRGSDEQQVHYQLKLPFDVSHQHVSRLFGEFLSQVYGYPVEVTSISVSQKNKTEPGSTRYAGCQGCTNVSCLASDKGCKDAW